MLDVGVNGLWGTREEGPREIAERWFATLEGLRRMDAEIFDDWHEAGKDLPSDPLLTPSVPALTEYIERKNTGPDLDVVGYTTSLWARNDGTPHVSSAIHAGGSSPYVANSVAISFVSRTMDETAEVIRRAPEILRVVADAWGIDGGQVYSRSQFRAVSRHFSLKNSDPRCGRAVYLSARRAELAPEGLPGTYTRTASGGLVIDLTHGGTAFPSDEEIIEVNTTLRATGALEPLPVPFDRATL